jgi:hypothetical protein
MVCDADPMGRVVVEGASISIEVTLVDAEIAEILQQVPEGRRVEFVTRGLRSGLIAMGNDMTTKLREAMRFMQTTLDAQVSSFGERMAERVREQLGDADKDGHVQRRVQEILSRMTIDLRAGIEKALPEVFDGQTKKSVERIQAEGDRVMKEITALFSENGIAFREIREVRRDFALRLEELKTAMTIAQTKTANPSPREAGLDYEQWIHGQLASIGSLRGDDVELVAGKAGRLPRCLKGDTRVVIATDGVEVSAPPVVAIEIRDREDSEFTLDDVATMVQNREAQVGMVIAAHTGSLPRQYADRPFAVSRPKRLITLLADPEVPGGEVTLAAAYQLACILAIESVRQSRDGDWDAVSRKVEEVAEAVEGMAEARSALGAIERKAHDAGSSADKRHAHVIRLVAELTAMVRP